MSTITQDADVDTETLSDEEAERIESPSTVAGWKKLLAAYPANSIKLMCKLRGGAGTAWTPGHTLVDVYSDTAIVIPPRHLKTEKVPLRSIKLWVKGMANLHHHMAREARPAGLRTPPGGGEKAFEDPSRIVVYSAKTGMFLGGGQGKRSFYCPLSHAAPYANSDSARVGVSKFFTVYPSGADVIKPTLEYMTKAMAIARFRDSTEPAPTPSGTDAEPAGNSAVAGTIEANLGAASAPVPPPEQKAETQEIVPPAAPAAAPMTAACATCFADWAHLRMEEAEAEAMLLEIRGKQMKAWARVEIDREKRKLGLA